MKKRIIAFILVLAMAFIALVGCAYNFAKDDMSKYASMKDTLDGATFAEALLKLVIADGDFTENEDIRNLKVTDVIQLALAKTADAEDKKTEGKAGKHDVVYYCYYCTLEVPGADEGQTETVIVLESNMKESAAIKLQLGLYANKDEDKDDKLEIDGVISDALADFDFTGNAYKTVTEGKVSEALKENYKMVVSFSKKYDPVADAPAKGKDTYSYVTLDRDTDPYLYDFLTKADNNVEIGKTKNPEKTTVQDGDYEYDVTYSGVKVQWITEGGAELSGSFKEVTYTTDKKVNDNRGVERNLKDAELTYHVFPVYFIETPELNATNILNTLLKDKLTAAEDKNEDGDFEDDEDVRATLECFENLEYKYTDTEKNETFTLNELIKKLAELNKTLADKEKALEDAEKKLDTAQTAVDTAGGEDKATQSQKDALAAAKKAVEDAEAAVTTARTDVNTETGKIFAITVEGGNIQDIIKNDYVKSEYEKLEDAYKAEIKANLASEVYTLLNKYIEYTDKLPKRAVNEMYDRLLNSYKYDYYKGNYSSTSTSKVTNYDYYRNKGKLLGFLKAQEELKLDDAATMKDAKAAIRKQAEEEVKDIIAIYVLADLYDIELTKEEAEAAESLAEYYNYIFGGDVVVVEDFKHADLFDKVMNHILEEKEEDEEATGNHVRYERVEYTIKVETEEDNEEEGD